MKRIVYVLAAVLCLYVVINLAQTGIHLYKWKELAQASRAYEVAPPGAKKKILVVGDSTGVGVGATDPADSIAGRIAGDFPLVEIVNRSANGARAEDVLEQLKTIDDTDFDVVLVQMGCRDILLFTDLDMLEDTVLEILHSAYQLAPNVIFMGTGNMGSCPAFLPPINRVYTERARKVKSMFVLLSRGKGVDYVDLFREKGDDEFLGDRKRFFAADSIHPSSDGYALWYEELKKQTLLAEILEPARS